MDSVLLIMSSFLKSIIILVGLGLTLWNVVKGFANDDGKAKKKAIKYFFVMMGILTLLTVLEFALALSKN